MDTSLPKYGATAEVRAPLGVEQRSLFAVACIAAGFLPVVVGYVPGDVARFACGLLVTGVLLALALLARRSSALHRYWEIPLAFFGLALFILADRYVPHFLVTHILHETPVPGNPLAATVSGTVIVQLAELLLTVIAVLVVVWISRSSLSSIYV